MIRGREEEAKIAMTWMMIVGALMFVSQTSTVNGSVELYESTVKPRKDSSMSRASRVKNVTVYVLYVLYVLQRTA